MTNTVMTADRLREVLDAMGTTQRGLGELTGWDGRLVRRWAAGKVRIPADVAGWLEAQAKLMVEMPQPRPEWFARYSVPLPR